MDTLCKKCGAPITDNSPICMNCGSAIPETDLSQETLKRLNEDKHDKHVANNSSSVKALGAFLLIVGFIIDFISIVSISTSSYDSFGALTVGGTICFFIGIFLFANG